MSTRLSSRDHTQAVAFLDLPEIRVLACRRQKVEALQVIARALPLLAALALSACAFDADDLDNWKRISKGSERLTGYLADVDRPADLRQHAAENLFEMGALGALFTAVDAVPAGERAKLLKQYVKLADRHLNGDAAVEAGRAARVLFEVLRRHKHLEDTTAAVTTLTDWTLRWFANPDPPPTDVSIEDLLQAAAVVNPDVVRPRLVAFAEATTDERALLRLDQVLSALRDRDVDAAVARALLREARRQHPAISFEIAEAMMKNRNPVLLRFLLEAARDPRVAPGVRNLGGVTAAQLLGKDGMDGLFRLVASDDPSTNNVLRFNAIDYVWRFGGVQELDRLLRALPPSGWPREGAAFKSEVDGFCDKLATASAQVRRVLVDLVGAERPITRTYAMECVVRLYPDDAPVILESLLEDPTPLHGWSEAGPTTIGEVVRALSEG